MRPNTGPTDKIKNKNRGSIISLSMLKSWILNTVIKKPIALAMVRAVPFSVGDTDCAISVVNCGESAITDTPQTNKKRTII